jgi:uncharacterized protein YkwD
MKQIKRTAIILTTLALLLSAAPALTAGAAEAPGAGRQALRNTMASLVNGSRRHHGIRPLNLNFTLSRKAYLHSKRMATRNSVYHTTDLYSLVRRYSPSTWGENVGMAGTLKRMEFLFMHSAPHRANILNRRFRHLGVGVYKGRGYIWVTLDFYGG